MTGDLLSIRPDLCTACGACAAVCPQRLLFARDGAPPEAAADAAIRCLHCGHCVAACPHDALAHAELGSEGFPPAPPQLDYSTVLGLLRSRRSVRAYHARAVGEETVRELLDAARYAPTGHNSCHVGCAAVLGKDAVDALRDRLVSFYGRLLAVVRNPVGRFAARLAVGSGRVDELLQAVPGFERAADGLQKGEDPLFHGAPAVLLFHAPRGNETSEVDCALAAGQVTLLAPTLGLGTCYIGYASAALKRRPGIGRAAGVPGGRVAFTVLSLGYPSISWQRLVPRQPLACSVVAQGKGLKQESLD